MSDAITPQSTTAANIPGNGWSIAPATSLNGSWLVFASDSTNLGIADAGGFNLIYLKDTKTGTLTSISLPSTGQIPNSNSTTPVISDDGRYVVFQSYASNLIGVDNNNDSDVFLKDTQTGTLKLLSGTSGTVGTDSSGSPAISADGRYVVFQSRADNLASDDPNGAYDIYRADTQTGTVTPVSLNAQNSFGDQNSVSPSVSANGQIVAFASDAINLVTNDGNGSRDIFVKDMETKAVTLVSANAKGELANGRSDSPALSADGKNVAFLSNAPNFGKAINDGYSDIYVKNLANGTLTLASADSAGQQANANSWSPVIDNTGKYVAFLSDATNLVSGDTNDSADIFVKEISTGKIERISADSLGGKIYRGPELNKAISISNDGKWILFSATSSTSNGVNEVFKAANPIVPQDIDITLPTAVSFSPANNATGIGVGVNIVVAFSEAIKLGSGNIVLKSDGTVVATYDAATSNNLSISGSTLTINPSADLSSNITYTVEFAPGSIKDLASNSYAGTSSYNFTTGSGSSPMPTPGNDTFTTSSGNDIIDGLGGIDTMIFTGTRTGHTITKTPTAGLTVSSLKVSSSADGADTLSNVERLKFSDSGLAFDLISPNSAGGIYRLYGATFNRTPDLGGLGYWIDQADKGKSAVAMALDFVYSPEFKTLYAAKIVDNYATGDDITKMVTGFYKNVLHREPDAGGRDYYVGQITSHSKTVGQVLAEISDSPENIASLTGVMENGVVYTPWV